MKKAVPIIIATIRPWNIARAKQWKPPAGYRKILITKKEDLTAERLKKLAPRYVFFPHWSWIIPNDAWKNFECIVFHMTDLPFGRGGSPLQNLLVRGMYKTKVSAIRVVAGLDAGPVYLKRPLNISKGSAEQIFNEVSKLSFEMMGEILKRQPKPKRQNGKAVVFQRRSPEMSRMPSRMTIRQIYDFIRMLDAPEYPVAFIEHGNMRIEFRNAQLRGKELYADITIITK